MDQAARLRALMGRTERRARFLAISSGKGGVGKTNLAINLASALAARGKRVVVVDVDIGLANADVLLGLRARHNLAHVLSGEVTAAEALLPVPGGWRLLPGAMGGRHLSDLDEAERAFLIRSLADIAGSADLVLLDTAAGISSNVIQFALACEEVLVVTAPEPAAITDSYALIKAISREKGGGRLRLIVNMATGAAEAMRVSERIRGVAQKFLSLDVGLLGWVALDDHVRKSVRLKRPFLLEFPRAPASEHVRCLAEKLLTEEPATRPAGFVKQFATVIHTK